MAIAERHPALGEEVFKAAWTQGRAMRLEQAIGYALSADCDAN